MWWQEERKKEGVRYLLYVEVTLRFVCKAFPESARAEGCDISKAPTSEAAYTAAYTEHYTF